MGHLLLLGELYTRVVELDNVRHPGVVTHFEVPRPSWPCPFTGGTPVAHQNESLPTFSRILPTGMSMR